MSYFHKQGLFKIMLKSWLDEFKPKKIVDVCLCYFLISTKSKKAFSGNSN